MSINVKDVALHTISDFLYLRHFGTEQECEKAVYLYPSDVMDFLSYLDSEGERNACEIAAAFEEALA